jgi:tetratricopeptide (TPR) repeat protein
VLLLGVFGVSMATAQRRTSRALADAEVERDKAEEVSEFLEGLFTAANPMSPQRERLDTVRAAALLARGVVRADSQLTDRPAVRARLLRAIGDAYIGMGREAEADTLLQRAIRLLRDDGTDRAELADALNTFGILALSTNRSAEAEAPLREALVIRRELYGHDERRTTATLANIAASLQDQNRFDEAVQIYDELIALHRSASAPDTVALASVMNGRANLAFRLDDFDTAITLAREILAIERARVGERHPSVALHLNNLAILLRNAGRTEESATIQVEATALTREVLGPDHPRTALAVVALAQSLAATGKREDAKAKFEEAVLLTRRAIGPQHPELARALSLNADLLLAMGDTAAAQPLAREAWEMNGATLGLTHQFTGITQVKYAALRCADRAFAEAIAAYRAAIGVLDVAGVPGDPWPVQVRIGLGRCLVQAGRATEAEAHLLSAWELAGRSPAFERLRAGIARTLIDVYDSLGTPERAGPWRAAAADTTH